MRQGVEEDTLGARSRHNIADVECIHYSVLQTVHTPTLSITHHIPSAHGTTLTDMPSATQPDKEFTSAPYDQGDCAHTR